MIMEIIACYYGRRQSDQRQLEKAETLKRPRTSMSLHYILPESSVAHGKQQTPQGTNKLL